MEDLKAFQQQVKNRVALEETQHRKRLDLLEFFYILFGKNVFLLLDEVKILKLEGDFKEVSEPLTRSVVEVRPSGPTIGLEIMLEVAWNRLMKDGVGIMGLHSMGGFGEMAGGCQVIIWVVVSQGTNISKLQEDIAQKLHLCDGECTNKNEGDKAADITRVLKGKRFVLMLDHIWEKVDLEAIVAFTTRSLEVCKRMGDHEPMQVNCLEKHIAWELFEKMVGGNTLKSDPEIVELARKVAESCCGLPLALIAIGETMSYQTTVQEWELAVDVLTRSAAEFSDMENKILLILKYSYDSLVAVSTVVTNLIVFFLASSRFLETCDFFVLVELPSRDLAPETAMNKGYVVLDTLIHSNLLTESNSRRGVVMHDVVREMALWTASKTFFGSRCQSNFPK
ncbi:hypothetical protein EUTSA_v10024085mg [Eutrema salsugineum]|uniref:NB-ARC domain-containing protein n=1 Tax=Eutrema salsugineum TaxID=72664 RepID=V4KHJ1_EUTSA|nr:hypothetical protein EUTSA_v10024085mg [Eutrema salsugineum]